MVKELKIFFPLKTCLVGSQLKTAVFHHLDIEIVISSKKLNLGKYENYDKRRPQFARENEPLFS